MAKDPAEIAATANSDSSVRSVQTQFPVAADSSLFIRQGKQPNPMIGKSMNNIKHHGKSNINNRIIQNSSIELINR